MSKIDMSTMVRVKYSETICWKRLTGRHWIYATDANSDGGSTCIFCGVVLPKSEVDRAMKERGEWRKSLTSIQNGMSRQD